MRAFSATLAGPAPKSESIDGNELDDTLEDSALDGGKRSISVEMADVEAFKGAILSTESHVDESSFCVSKQKDCYRLTCGRLSLSLAFEQIFLKVQGKRATDK